MVRLWLFALLVSPSFGFFLFGSVLANGKDKGYFWVFRLFVFLWIVFGFFAVLNHFGWLSEPPIGGPRVDP